MTTSDALGDSASRVLRVARGAAVLVTAAIGAGSFVLSFAALRDLVVRAGWSPRLAWVWPLIVDGAVLMATMGVLALTSYTGHDRSRRFFWWVLTAAAAISVAGNALHAVIPRSVPITTWLSAAIGMVPPLMLLAATHGLSLLGRVRATHVADAPAPCPGGVDTEREAIAAAAERDSTVDIPRGRWVELATALVEQSVVKDATAEAVADALYLSYERQLSHRAIGRQLRMDHRAIGKIVTAGSDLLRSGRIVIAPDVTAAC